MYSFIAVKSRVESPYLQKADVDTVKGQPCGAR